MARISKKDVALRENFIKDYFKAHPKATAQTANEALAAQTEINNARMRLARVYELKREVESGGVQLPTINGVTPPAPQVAYRTPHRPIANADQAVKAALKTLRDAGLSDVQIDYTVRRVVKG